MELLAPNGKPSNLTSEQYKLVRTPEFKKWFGDWENDPENSSKVVDENGEPMVVYHGSKNEFYVFDKKRIGENYIESEQGGFFFTQKKRSAENYAELHSEIKSKCFVYECFLNIKNPIIRNTNSEYHSPIDRYDMSRSEYIHEIRLNKTLDGIIIFGTKKDNLYVVNKPNQIKLADGSNTTFNVSNPDIRFEEGGEVLFAPNGKQSNLTPEQYLIVRTPEFKKWFGDWENSPETASKIVDNNGEPLVCYHGSKRDFNVFDKKLLGTSNDLGYYGHGFYFTFQKDEKWMKSAIGEASYYGGIVKEFFIKAINPFVFNELSTYKGVDINVVGAASIIFLYNISKKFPSLSNVITIDKKTYNSKTKEYDITQVPIGVLDNLIEKYSNDLVTFETEMGSFGEKVISGYLKSKSKEVFYDNTETGGKKGSYIDFDTLDYVNNKLSKEEIEIILITKAIDKYDGLSVRYYAEGYMTRYPEITELIKENHDCIMQGNTGDELVVFDNNQIKLSDGTNTTFDSNNPDIRYANGGEVYENKQIYKKWKSLVNMTKTELEKFYNSEEGKEAGLTPSEAKEKGIDSGRESARWIMKMKDTPISEWTNSMWRWAKKQISFISRMRGNKGGLYDENGNKTRKHTSLLIWGHNPVKNKFNNGGQLLLAPNGESSNLTSEQYKLVRTPEFKAWFGDWENDPENSSKVLDENGEPMVCYHGTNRDFSVFDIKEIGQGSGNLGHYGYGFYFSEDIIEAKVYGSNILKCFLKIKNPFLNINENFDLLKQHGFFGIDEKVAISIDFDDFFNKIALIDSKAYEFVKIAKEKGLDNVWDIYLENNSSSDSNIDLNSLYDILLYTDLFKQNDYKVPDYVFTEIEEIGIQPKLNYDYEFEQSLHWVTNLGENSKEVTRVIKSLGFDGIIVGSEFVLFESSQIKLADGLNTTFDENNPDIRFENGGMINKDNFYKNTFANFIEISENEIPNREPDFISDWNSKYWYEDDYVIRQSDHWGKLDTCIWLLNMLSINKLTQGKCKLSDFNIINDSGLTKIGNDIYISRDISKLPKDTIILEHRYNDKIKAGELGIFTGEVGKVDSGFGKDIAYISIGKNAKIITINSSEDYLDENLKGKELEDFNKYILHKYSDDRGNHKHEDYKDFFGDAGILENPSTAWYELEKKTIEMLEREHGKFDVLEMKWEDDLVPHQYLILNVKNPDLKFKDGGQLNKDLMEKAIIEDIIINPNEEYSEFVNEKAIDYVLLFPKYQNLTKEEALFIYKYFSNYENLIDKNGNYIAQIKWNYVYGSNNKDAKKDDELLRKFIEKMDKHGIIVFDYYNSVIEADKAVIDFINAVRGRIKNIVSNVINKNNDSELEEINLLIELTEDTLKENKSDEELQMYLELLKDTKEQLIKSNNNKFADGGIVDNDTWKKWQNENFDKNGNAHFELNDGTEVFIDYANSIIKIQKRRFKNGLDVITLKEDYSPKKIDEIKLSNELFDKRIKELVFGNISFEISDNKRSLVQNMNHGGQLINDITETENFKKWIDGSKFINTFTGKPNIYYHQTHKDNLESIEKYGFNIDIIGARKGDTEMPDGVFLKNNDTDISIGGNSDEVVQIPVYISAKNTKYFDNRSDLTEYLSKDDIYVNRLNEFNTHDKEMSRRFEDVWSSDGKIKYERGTPEYKIQFEEQNKILQDILNKWKSKNKELSQNIRKRVTEIFKSEGYDSIVVRNDEGSFGRMVWTVVVFNPTDIKSAINNIGTFDKNKKGIIYDDGGAVPIDKIISASSRFKPSETVLFDPPLEGKNGAKLISYTWSYEWTMTPNYEGELKSKRVSDWSQAEISADTGRDIVHQYTVLMPNGEYKTVSSDSVPILLGYIDRKELKSFPNLVTASKTLAKQQMQLAIMEAQKKEYDELYSKFEKAEKPEIKEVEETSKFSAAIESWKKGAYSNYAMGDIIYRQDNDYVYETKEYKKRPITKDTIEQLTSFWISKRVEEAGGINPRGLYDLKNRVARQKRKVENILSAKMENGGEMEDFDWESLYNPSPEEQKIRDEEHKKSLEQEKEDWYQNTKFSKKWAATYKDAVNRTVKEYLDAKATYDDWASRQYKQNKGMVFLGGDDVFGEAKSIGSINEGRRQRVLRGSKMQMDESIETLKELGLSENEINDLIQNKKMANGGEINNYSDKVKFLINKYGNMSFDEFKQYATSYQIESYDDMKTWSNRDYMVIDKYPIIIKVFNTNGYNIELRKSDEKLKYVAVDKNGNIIRDDRGLALYQSDEELISKGIPLYDSSIYAFHEGKNIGFISNSWNVPELFVRPEYQKLGIGTELLWQYLIQDNGYFMDNRGFLGQYTSQGIIAIKKLHKRFVEESKMLV